MKDFIADHTSNIYLKPGEILISPEPIMVSTILGSCVAVIMFSPTTKVGAICHAMYPQNPKPTINVQYVDSAICYIFNQMMTHSSKTGLTVKLFGGAQVLAPARYEDDRRTVGEQNVEQAKQTLRELGLSIASGDTGGSRGRKLLFSIKTGDVFVRKLRTSDEIPYLGE